MNIYFNGDSYVEGSELDDPTTQSFASKLSAKLGATFINQAEGGSSNSLILRKVHEYLYECKKSTVFPDLVVIGWSEPMREDWFFHSTYHSVAGTGPRVETFDLLGYQYWARHMNDSFQYLHQMSKFYNRAIHNLHCELTYLKIPHVFFNAIVPLNTAEIHNPDSLQDDPLLKLSWGDNFFYPYDQVIMTWRGWALAHNYQEVTPGKFHFKEDCHEAWSDVIYNYIKEKNIV